MRKNIHSLSSTCQSCVENTPVPFTEASILPYPIPQRLWNTVAVYILKLPRSERGFAYILVFMDSLLRFCILVPLQNKTAKSVARASIDELICRYSTPKILLSGYGSEYNNEFLQEISSKFEIKKDNIVVQLTMVLSKDSTE